MWRKFYVLMAEADAGEGGSASGGSGADASGASGDNGQGAAANGGAGDGAGTQHADGGASVLASQAQAPTIPEKYQVKKEDGSLDVEASSLKLAEAYGNLEKRLGTGDLPPKTADEYTIPVPDDMKDLFDPKTDPLMGDFLKNAHAAGMTQKQIDLVMGKYFELAPQLFEGGQQLTADACVADLKQEWKTDDQYKEGVGKAFKAAQAFGGNDAEALVKEYGNDPRIIRLLARVGAELDEDTSFAPGDTSNGGNSIESLMQSEAYSNPKHADHARVSAQVQSYFDSKAKAAAKAGSVPLI